MYQAKPSSSYGTIRAILIAGPLFVTLIMAAWLYRCLPDPIPVSPFAITATLMILGLALLFGPLVACIPVALGAALMRRLSGLYPAVASRGIWLATGLAIGTAVALVLDLPERSPETTFALILTSGFCAWLSNYQA